MEYFSIVSLFPALSALSMNTITEFIAFHTITKICTPMQTTTNPKFVCICSNFRLRLPQLSSYFLHPCPYHVISNHPWLFVKICTCHKPIASTGHTWAVLSCQKAFLKLDVHFWTGRWQLRKAFETKFLQTNTSESILKTLASNSVHLLSSKRRWCQFDEK